MKSTLKIKNPTDYFVPGISKEFLDLPNPDCFQTSKAKMEGYETRLFYEYEYTKKKLGFAMYVTLTYNNKHIPMFYGIPCLRNSDIHDLFQNQRFFRNLKSYNGYQLKYFVGAELGEGGKDHNYKGQRGEGNNPHYHVILFFTPLDNFVYVDRLTGEVVTTPHLSPSEVADVINHYWQGSAKFKRNYKRGMVHYGKRDPFGVLQDSTAISYASKYCVKDVSQKERETLLLKRTYKQVNKKANEAFPDENDVFKRSAYRKELQDKIIRDFRSNHSYRVLCSQGLGKCAIDSVVDPMNPVLPVPSKKGILNRSLPQYIYRKMYYDIVKDSRDKYFYKLNDLGKQYKVQKLSDDIEKLTQKTYDYVYSLVHNSNLFNAYLNSDDHNYPVPFTSIDPLTNKPKILISTNLLLNNLINSNSLDTLDNIFYKFSIYEKVYKHRYYCDTPFGDDPLLEPDRDYLLSLESTHLDCYHYSVYDSDPSVQRYKSFDLHPYFAKDIGFFNWFSDVNSFFNLQRDHKDKKSFEEWKRFRQLQKNINS